jgi:hypothetical protein
MAVQALGYLGISTQDIDETPLRASWDCSWSTVGFPAGPSVWMIVASESSLTRSVRMPSAFSGGRSPMPQALTPSRGSSKQPVLPCNLNRRHLSINGWFLT